LIQLAEESGLRAQIDVTFRGEKINVTENRAVLHVALRAPEDASFVVDGENVVPRVHTVLAKMEDLSNRVRNGQWKSFVDGERGRIRTCDPCLKRASRYVVPDAFSYLLLAFAMAYRNRQ
jgi:glucose-6-phosphate isomerase